MAVVGSQSCFGVSCLDEVLPARVGRRCPERAVAFRTPPGPKFVEVGEVIGRVSECAPSAASGTVGNEEDHLLLFVYHGPYGLCSPYGRTGFLWMMPHGDTGHALPGIG